MSYPFQQNDSIKVYIQKLNSKTKLYVINNNKAFFNNTIPMLN